MLYAPVREPRTLPSPLETIQRDTISRVLAMDVDILAEVQLQ
jgi:hypothetical protein